MRISCVVKKHALFELDETGNISVNVVSLTSLVLYLGRSYQQKRISSLPIKIYPDKANNASSYV